MMEVKQNTAVDLNDLLTPVQNTDGTDEVDDVVMTDLTEGENDLNCDLIKSNEKSNNDLVTNGDETLSSLIDLDSTTAALEAPVSTELEDALLAEDDVLPKLTDVKVTGETSSVAVDDILADKVETSNSTTSSNNIRDPGDDLDTLLSKINDIVEDCLENEIAEGAVEEERETSVEKEAATTDLAADTKGGESFDESVIVLDDTVLDDSNCIENNKTSQADEMDTEMELNENHEKEAENEKAVAVATAAEEEKETEAAKEQDNKITDDFKCENDTASETSQTASKEEEGTSTDAVPKETASTETATVETFSTETFTTTKSTTDTFSKETSTSVFTTSTTECTTSTTKTEIETKTKTDTTIGKDDEEEAVNKKEEDELLEEVDGNDNISSDNKIEEDTKVMENENSLLQMTDEQESNDKDDVQESKVEDEVSKNEADISENVEKESKSEEHVADKADHESKESTTDDLLEDKNDVAPESIDDEQEAKKDEQKEKEVENEDSDDEIVFYVDKPPETEKAKATVEGESKTTKSTDETKPESVEQEEDKVKSTDDDDVVILDDDDEMQIDKKVPESCQQTEESAVDKTPTDDQNEKSCSAIETDEAVKDDQKHSTIDIDNSDNARDDFVVSEKATEGGSSSNKPQAPEETNSNCSSSSNLLLEAKQNENTGDEPNQEENDNENEEEDDDGDVELIETESKEAENSSEKGEESSEIVPPAKRPRLSEDSEVSSKTDETSRSQKSSESVDKKSEVQTETATATATSTSTTTTSSSLKRTHDVIELELDDDKSNDSKTSVTETLNKKPRTEDATPKAADKAQTADIDEKLPSKTDEDSKEGVAAKKDIVKMVPSEIPIPLYPPPKFKTLSSRESFSLDFLKKFRKSFDKMTKHDLEELVLQKVVEAIIHRSEFAEMRELIEKQEKLITSHRSKILELSKQFRDLEMVHNRVVKDIEQRNSQFIMPVKITRAVGLQVYIPNKKAVLESSASSGTVTPSPQRSAISSQSNLTSPQRQYHSTQAADAPVRSTANHTPSNTANSSTNTSSGQRRGCAQKITPIRPVPTSSSSASGSAPSGSSVNTQVYRNNLNQNQISSSSQPRILNKNASTASAGVPSNTNASSIQRPRYLQNSQDATQRLQQQQQQQQISRPTNNVGNSQRAAAQQKLATSAAAAQRRPEPTSSAGSNSSASLDNYMNTLSQLTGGNTAVSITPAKPKEKAVIDLTDEDETPPAPPIISPQQTNNVPASQGQRRSLPVQSTNANSTLQQFGRTAAPLARTTPTSQLANSNKNRQMALQGQKNNSSFASTISTPPGTSITRINVAANTQGPQRVKYSHPAPLPATPAQAFNPSWKLPPPRPTIRISNLDNGIVISWTMEESMDRHAECVSYQIYAYQETSGPPMADSWRHVGDVKAMLLPMAVTLTQFQEGQRYFFAVRAVDCHQRYGPFSLPKTWS